MIILSSAPLPEDIRKHLQANYPTYDFHFCNDIEEARPLLSKAEVLLTYGEDLTDTLIDEAEQLKWIMVLSAGMDEMPFEEIKRKRILVTNSRGIHKIPMAEYAISMILQVSRNAALFLDCQRNHQWARGERAGLQEITSKTMVIVGAGAIGQEVARLAKAFRMKTMGISTTGTAKANFDEMYTQKDFPSVLANADFVISVLPSTEETKGFFRYEHFERMPESAIFLNMGRGDAVAGETIIKALDDRQISHAVLDVFEQEPLPEDHPLWDHEKVTVTPHVSGASPEYLPRAMDIFEENLEKYLSGSKQLINHIDLDRGY
ncbi:D-2-hydroxyacid dehydrogenase [Sediminibacillus albus]|uniref:Phosphoglycerate dehydrogenase n=1 Tax=Sediminibacillus albus TaxID=407036 RepID=A0A1G9B4H1_9BACI|nr:D-2-hydroxyacid dehydrogenase [Sediminibacillus albus]SDK33735.1 Phosphoglycerate dehydrogenase [Sediminibacillus albus]